MSESKSCFNVKSSTYYFHMKTNILADFPIYISVPLKKKLKVSSDHVFHQKSEANLKWILKCISTISCYSCTYHSFIILRKHLFFRWFYIRSNKNDAKSIETGRTIITHSFSWSGQEICSTSRFLVIYDKSLFCYYL